MSRKTAPLALLVSALLFGTTAVALAASNGSGPNRSSSSSINLVMPQSGATAAASPAPSFGGPVTFDVSTDATARPFVDLQCFQNGTQVMKSSQAWFYGAYGEQLFYLGPTPAWQGGAADCTAYLENWDSYGKNGKISVLASTGFQVNG
jgi:hypothetical protein